MTARGIAIRKLLTHRLSRRALRKALHLAAIAMIDPKPEPVPWELPVALA